MGDKTVGNSSHGGGVQGTDYQIKLLLNCLLRSKEQFELQTEVKSAGKWDDIVYKGSDGQYRFFQVKHKVKEEEKIKSGDLLSIDRNNPYALFKYYESYKILKVHYHNCIKDVVLFTNIDLDDKIKAECEEITTEDHLIKFELTNKSPRRYRLNESGSLIRNAKLVIATAEIVKTAEKRKPLPNKLWQRYATQLEQIFSLTKMQGDEKGLKSRLEDKLRKRFRIEKKNSKKPDGTFDKDVEDFLDHLVLAVNQPNEKQLSELMLSSLDSTKLAQSTFSFSIKSVETASKTLESQMRQFFKYLNGVQLTQKDADDWKNSIEEELGKLFNVGCYYDYHQKLDCISLSDDIANQLKRNQCILQLETEMEKETLVFYIETELDPLLTAILVRSALKSVNKREQFLFTNLKSASSTEQIKNDWESRAVRMVIVDEEQSTKLLTDLLEIICRPSKAEEKNTKKGFVVIISKNLMENVSPKFKLRKIPLEDSDGSTQDVADDTQQSSQANPRKRSNTKGPECNSSNKKAKEGDNELPEHRLNRKIISTHKFEKMDIDWTSLTEESRQKLENKPVEFQGHQVALSKFGLMERIINNDTLLELVKKMQVPIEIGTQFSNPFDPVSNCYVSRTMNCRLLKGKAVNLGAKRFCFDRGNFTESAEYWVQEEEEKKCRNKRKKRFLLKQSRGQIQELRGFVDEKRTKRFEERSLNTDIKVAIISDLAGMGKTAILNSLWNRIKERNPVKWIVKLDLNDRATTTALDRIDPSETSSAVSDFFGAYNEKASPLEKILFELHLEIGNLVVMLDSFDEIRPEYQLRVLLFLKDLLKMRIAQLWITTRPHFQETLEDELGQFSITLQPFSRDDQIKYLNDYWSSRLVMLSDKNTKKLEEFATNVVDLLAESIRDSEKNFTGVPLQCRMLAESFQHHLLDGENRIAPVLPKRLNLTDLYELFWRRKCQMFLKDKGKAHGASSFAQFVDKFFERTCALMFQKLALKLLFPRQDFQFLWQMNPMVENLLSPLENEIHSFGLTIRSKSGAPRFIHQTVGEFFVARFFVDHLLKDLHPNKAQFIEFIFDKILSDEKNFHVTRSFINGLLPESARDTGIVSREQDLKSVRRVIVVAAKDGHHKIVNLILQGYWILASALGKEKIRRVFGDREDINEEGLLGPDTEGWTPVHWAAARGNDMVLKVIFEFAMKKDISTSRLLAPDVKFGETPMHRASLLGQCKTMRFIVDYLENRWVDPRSGRDFRQRKGWGWNLLRWAVRHDPLFVGQRKLANQWDVVTLLGPDKNKESTLHRAASQGNAESVKILLDAAFHFQVDPGCMLGRGLYGETPLHRAALRGSKQVIEEIFNYLEKCNVSPVQYLTQDHYEETPFHRAASRGRHEVIVFLAEKLKERSINPLDYFTPDWDRMTPLSRAAESGFYKVVTVILKIYQENATASFIEENLLLEWGEMTWAAANGHTETLKMIFDFLHNYSSRR